MMPPRVAIIGGGITGLATAYWISELAKEAEQPVQLTLLESQYRLGGVIETEQRDGWLVERGPDAWLMEKPAARSLCERLGIVSDVIPTQPEHRHSFVLRRGRLLPVPKGWYLIAPTSWPALWDTPVLSWRGKLRVACEPWLPPRRDGGDESVASFIRRRFGRETLARIGQPMVAGIYTAYPEQLSADAALGRFREMERQQGSVLRALHRRQDGPEGQASGPRYSLFGSFRRGMSQLVEALSRHLPAGTVRTAAPVAALEAVPEGWRITLADGAQESADAVCLAIPADRAAALLQSVDAALAKALLGIPYASVATVNLAFDRADAAELPAGSGFVVPVGERRRMVGCSFSSLKFAGRAPEGGVLLRAFVGGIFDPGVCAMADDEVVMAVRMTLRQVLGIHAMPRFSVVQRHERSMPQYRVGHLDRVRAIEARAAAMRGLYLAGNGYRGIGIPDCAQQGQDTARLVLASLAMRPQLTAASDRKSQAPQP